LPQPPASFSAEAACCNHGLINPDHQPENLPEDSHCCAPALCRPAFGSIILLVGGVVAPGNQTDSTLILTKETGGC